VPLFQAARNEGIKEAVRAVKTHAERALRRFQCQPPQAGRPVCMVVPHPAALSAAADDQQNRLSARAAPGCAGDTSFLADFRHQYVSRTANAARAVTYA
jgi:hypothetical protein